MSLGLVTQSKRAEADNWFLLVCTITCFLNEPPCSHHRHGITELAGQPGHFFTSTGKRAEDLRSVVPLQRIPSLSSLGPV